MMEAEGLVDMTPARRAALAELDALVSRCEALEAKLSDTIDRVAWLEAQGAMAEDCIVSALAAVRSTVAELRS
jgi:hypothetical protein